MTDTSTLAPTDQSRAEFDAWFIEHNDLHPDTNTTFRSDAWEPWKAWQAARRAPAPASSEPYAYEFSRDNGDGTHSVHIERGSLQEVVPGRWEHVGPPKDALVDTSIKALYTTPQPSQSQAGAVPLTDGWIRSRCKESWIFDTVKQWVRMTEAAHGIVAQKGEKT